MAMMHSSCSSGSAPLCAGHRLIVELAAALHAQFLGHRDLHVLDEPAAPQGSNSALPNRSAMRFCTAPCEIVIDPVNLLFGEDRADLRMIRSADSVSWPTAFPAPLWERSDDRGLRQFWQMTENKFDAVEKRTRG